MRNLEHKPTLEFDTGWVVHFYGKDRRLLFAMEPSHGWMFFAGCIAGLLIGIVGYNVSQTETTPGRPVEPSITAPLSVD
ncbi:MAG: hypothetical protein AAFY26_24885 [Cyanobacteria bacterium J06638_22]